MFEAWVTRLGDFLNRIDFLNALIALFILTVGYFVSKRLRTSIQSLNHVDAQQRLLLNKIAYYGVLIGSILGALAQVGVNLKVLLGAAGILTVAVGFAAQTSASNLISGLFLMIERPFGIGDVIAIGETRGVVMSIDLLSSKIRTFNNLMVRIPNETLMKSNVINYSYFPLRRLDFNINVDFDSDLVKVEKLLREIAEAHPLALADPKPVFLFNGIGEWAMTIQFQVWTMTENLVAVQNEVYLEIKKVFDAHKIKLADKRGVV